MKIAQIHSHLNGHEWLLVHKPAIWREIESTIKAVNALKLKTKRSKEKTKKGRKVYAPRRLNKEFAKSFQ